METNQTIIKHKLGLLNLAEELGNVSKACKVMGLSRDTFYRYKAAVDEGGVEALFDKTMVARKPITIEIAYMEKTHLGGYRHPRFIRFRPDKDPSECVIEEVPQNIKTLDQF